VPAAVIKPVTAQYNFQRCTSLIFLKYAEWNLDTLKYLCDKPFKAQWQVYVPPALTVSNSAFCVYGFRIINEDYLLKER
jgi:hypothetical protein